MQVGRQLRAIAVVASMLGIVAAVNVESVGAATSSQNVQAAGPIGTGWREYDPPRFLQIQSRGKYTTYPRSAEHARGPGGSYDREGGTETFKLFNNGASNRVEVRIQDNYTSGMRQFEGELRVSSPTNNEACMQILGRQGGGAQLMIRAYSADGGTLKAYGMRATLATGIYGKWVRLNVIHDVNARKMTIYVNGSSAGTWASSVNKDYYFKYGVYGTLKTPTAQTEWRNVRFYRK